MILAFLPLTQGHTISMSVSSSILWQCIGGRPLVQNILFFCLLPIREILRVKYQLWQLFPIPFFFITRYTCHVMALSIYYKYRGRVDFIDGTCQKFGVSKPQFRKRHNHFSPSEAMARRPSLKFLRPLGSRILPIWFPLYLLDTSLSPAKYPNTESRPYAYVQIGLVRLLLPTWYKGNSSTPFASELIPSTLKLTIQSIYGMFSIKSWVQLIYNCA